MGYWRAFISACFLAVPACAFADTPPGHVVERVVAVVNGHVILWSELSADADRVQAELKKSGSADAAEPRAEIERRALDQMINDILLSAEIERRGLSVTDATVDSAIATVMKQNNLKSTADLERALKREGLTMEGYRTTVKKQIETSRLLNEAIRPKIQITDKDVENEYRRSSAEKAARSLYKLRMIFRKKSSPRSDRKSMERLLRDMKAGVPFERIADRETEGAGKGEGGLIGAVALEDLQPELAKAVKALKPGETSSVVATNQGAYIVQYVEPVKPQAVPMTDSEKNEIRERLTDAEMARQFDAFVRNLRGKAQIEVLL
ncbi:MAG: SurA N-terminal domain-containing protein [Pseudomonadota bacterium]